MPETESTLDTPAAPTEDATIPATEPTSSTEVDALELLVTIFRRGEKAHGVLAKRPWPQLVCDLKRGSKAKEKVNLGGWCPVQFSGNHRTLEAVKSVHALVLDIDNKVPGKKDTRVPDDEIVTIDAVLDALVEYEVYVYTSWNHDAASNWPRFRALIPFERPVTGAEYPAVWAAYRERLVAMGTFIDEQTKDASRLWFWPAASRPGYETRHQRGRPLAVDDVLSAAEDKDRVQISS